MQAQGSVQTRALVRALACPRVQMQEHGLALPPARVQTLLRALVQVLVWLLGLVPVLQMPARVQMLARVPVRVLVPAREQMLAQVLVRAPGLALPMRVLVRVLPLAQPQAVLPLRVLALAQRQALVRLQPRQQLAQVPARVQARVLTQQRQALLLALVPARGQSQVGGQQLESGRARESPHSQRWRRALWAASGWAVRQPSWSPLVQEVVAHPYSHPRQRLLHH